MWATEISNKKEKNRNKKQQENCKSFLHLHLSREIINVFTCVILYLLSDS